MNRQIQISVLGIQNFGSEPEAILTKTKGMYCCENNLHKISYCELDETGTATDNLLTLSAEKMELNKSGSVATKFLFIPDETTITEYLTPFGKFVFEVKTESYSLNIKDNHLKASLKYKLFTNKVLFSENTLTIQVCADNGKNDGVAIAQ